MWRCVKIVGWILLAPVAWVAGSVLLCVSPVAYVLERLPVQGLPQCSLSAHDVAGLNGRLAQYSEYYWWNIAPGCVCYYEDECRAVPTADGGLELVRVRPALGWWDAEAQKRLAHNEKERKRVLTEWIAEIRQKGEGYL